jgi:hypothetical protein
MVNKSPLHELEVQAQCLGEEGHAPDPTRRTGILNVTVTTSWWLLRDFFSGCEQAFRSKTPSCHLRLCRDKLVIMILCEDLPAMDPLLGPVLAHVQQAQGAKFSSCRDTTDEDKKQQLKHTKRRIFRHSHQLLVVVWRQSPIEKFASLVQCPTSEGPIYRCRHEDR